MDNTEKSLSQEEIDRYIAMMGRGDFSFIGESLPVEVTSTDIGKIKNSLQIISMGISAIRLGTRHLDPEPVCTDSPREQVREIAVLSCVLQRMEEEIADISNRITQAERLAFFKPRK